MMTRTAGVAGLLALVVGPVCGQGPGATPGNPPAVLVASGIDADGALVLVRYKTIYLQPTEMGGGGPIYNERSLSKVSLKDVKMTGRDGKEVTVEAARKMLGDKDTPVLASAWGQPLPPFYRTVFKDDILLFAFPREAPAWKAIEAPELPVRK